MHMYTNIAFCNHYDVLCTAYTYCTDFLYAHARCLTPLNSSSTKAASIRSGYGKYCSEVDINTNHRPHTVVCPDAIFMTRKDYPGICCTQIRARV
uniref:Uncharacterized protein n=1 Tax=Glossina palpalis gambiensis TaxID=67801 RepID=A0A1B0B280_9MUSC